MRGLTFGGLAATLGILIAVSGCSGSDPAPGSTIGTTSGGSGGMSGAAGGLHLGGDGGGGAGGAGAGGGGAGGTTAATGGSAGTTHGGSSSGGSSLGGSGSGGSKPAGMCKRVSASDADCADLDPTAPQAYACDDRASYFTLSGMHGEKCYAVTFVAGSQNGACCPP